MARDGDDGVRARSDEATRYRLAAEETLNQIDWCVNYLHRIGKSRIAHAIHQNCMQIRRAMSG